ncbi:RNA polymerase sigma-70 factor [Flavobacterium sp.]|uniref:RNA polymerase sigma-70 factor n=1 Tax=Flavobacterium sp. TaxID=239 RepID=UPI004033F725
MGSSNKTDLFLLQECCEGDVRAYEEIFSRYSGRLYQFSLKYTKDASVSEELMMDVMFWIWQNRERLSDIQNLPSYLFTAIRNKVFNHLRTRALETISLGDASAATIYRGQDPSGDQLEFEDLQKQYEKCLEMLSPQCKTVFMLSRHEELSYAEISQRLSISVKTVEGHVSAALRSLRKNMPRYIDKLPVAVFQLFFLDFF